ncbi:type II secretion system F family protein [Nocardia sp. NBC_01503]|uniref:type II secretion system F family protein n=1 Tax=Nocardia sp. NBC_01503 TaxID=2975997 RepID=UPI002E7AD0B1|nr:type II secretion system F family protein [Nocardia sp. NBC_01503]WTL36198.1 type II secretion system F family protein [Nocardia sp. NBC_01503]
MSWVGVLTASALLLEPGRIAARRRLARMRNAAVQEVSRVRLARRSVDPLATAATLDLFAAGLRSGLPAATAAGAVAPGAGEPLGSALRRVADLLALGADPVTAWEQATAGCADDAVAALARMARRSARSGAGLATAVRELAEQRRGAVEDAAAARAERAGVLIGGPLGLCFLPAFVCLGIVPVVIGLAGRVLGGGLL